MPRGPDPAARRVALLAAAISSFLNPFMVSAAAVALPEIGREFHADAVTLSWIVTSYLLATGAALLPGGRLADIHGRKRLFSAGLIGYMLASVLCAAASSAAALIAFRVLQGFAASLIFTNGVAILTSVYPPAERGRVLGLTVACVYAGSSLGPVLGGVLTQVLGWRAIFLATLVPGLAASVLVAWRLRGEWVGAPGERFDLAGAAIYTAMMVGVVYGLSVLPLPAGAWLIAAGVAAGAGFVRWEARAPHALIDLNLIRRNRAFALSNLAALLNYSAIGPTAFLLSLYLQYVKGLSPAHAGLVLIAQPVMQMLVSPFAGRLSDRLEPRVVASAGMALTCAALAGFIVLDAGTPIWAVVSILLVLGAGFGLFSSPNSNAIMSAAPPRAYGTASAVMGTMRLGGQMLGLSAVMVIFNVVLGRVVVTAGVLDRFVAAVHAAFTLFALACAAGVAASLARGNIREHPKVPVPGETL